MGKVRIFGGSIVLLAVLCFFPSVGWGATTPVACSAAGALQTAVNAAAVGDVLQVSGTCTENLIITTNNLTLEAVAAGATITANDPTKPVISVSARFVTIGGVNSSIVGIFTITGGTYGIAVANLASANVVNNTIGPNTDAGVFVSQTSVGNIGFIPATETTTQVVVGTGNTFIGNLYGVEVGGASSASIQGNTFTNSTDFDIFVVGNSHVRVAGNTLNSAKDGILVQGFSGATLSSPTAPSPFNALNTTTKGDNNSNLGVACDYGGYVDGVLGSITGAKGNVFTTFVNSAGVCINRLENRYIGGTWTVSGNPLPLPEGGVTIRSVTFTEAIGPDTLTGTVTVGTKTYKMTAVTVGSKLTIAVQGLSSLSFSGKVAFTDSDDFTFTVNEVDGKTVTPADVLTFSRSE